VKKSAIILSSVLLASPAAFAATETHSANYTYSLPVNGDVYPRLHLPGFDDLNGQRVLTRVDVRVQADVGANIAIENETSAPLTGWTLEGQHLVLAGFERENPQTFGPFAFLGGLFIEPITGTLQPSDGTPDSGPDYLATPSSTTIDSTLEMDPSYLDFFNGGGEVVAVVGPFTEFFLDGATLYDPKLMTGDATVKFADLTQTGTLSVVYEYTTVPEPGSACAILGAATLFVRFRRPRA
jgi:hypothetical protein